MGFWFALIAFIFTTAVSYVLRPRPRFSDRSPSRPSSVGEFQRPTAEEGRCIPYLAGTGLIEGPNVLWQGDYSAEAIVESGQTIGYKYFLGVAYGVCLGPIDRVVDVRFDQKVMTLGSTVLPGGQALAVDVSGVTVVALPADTYGSGTAAAQAVTGAIHAQTADDLSRVLYGYEVVTSWTRRLRFSISLSGGTPLEHAVDLIVGRYTTGEALAVELNTRMRAAGPTGPYSPIHFNWSYNSGTGKFTFGTGIIAAVTIFGDSEVLGMLGFNEGTDLVLTVSDSEMAPYATGAYRYFFALRAGTQVRWTNGSTNCHSFFGMDPGAPDMTASKMADLDRLTGLQSATFEPMADLTRVTVNAPELFGGIYDEGGILGVFDVYHGTEEQVADAYLEGQSGGPIPAWRGLCYVVAQKPYWGASPYLKTFSLMVERCPNTLGLAGGRHRIVVGGALGDDANPACLLYELLTEDRFGLAIPATMIDVTSFRAAGDTLHSEGLGMSMVIDSAADGLDLVQDVMRHVDGVLYSDPETAQLTLKLIRADYDVSALPVLDETSVFSVKLSRPTWPETKNVVKVQYTDRVEGHTQRVVQIQNLANVQMIGRMEVEEVAFHGLSNREAAEIVGERALRVLCYPLAQLEIVANRVAQRLRPGSLFVLNWPPLGISGLVCRTGQLRPGEIRNNRITIECAEDVYALERATYSAIA